MKLVYVTKSAFKKEENEIFHQHCTLNDGTPIQSKFSFEIRQLAITETLEVDISAMVRAEALSAYQLTRVACMVEHAGLIFEEYESSSYPGGLTKPMWNTLGDRFVSETRSAGRRAIARAVVGYCDGMSVRTFVGETSGTLADSPRGSRKFYWDTVFVPDDPNGLYGGKTYAEIVEDPGFGLRHKVEVLSQSTKAKKSCLEHILNSPAPALW